MFESKLFLPHSHFTPIMEYRMMFLHAHNDKLEISPLPRNTTILTSKTGAKELAQALNYLGKQGWRVDSVTNLKKMTMMQWTLKRSLKEEKIFFMEYVIMYQHGAGVHLSAPTHTPISLHK